jgi:hypothetical protein
MVIARSRSQTKALLPGIALLSAVTPTALAQDAPQPALSLFAADAARAVTTGGAVLPSTDVPVGGLPDLEDLEARHATGGAIDISSTQFLLKAHKSF